MFEGFWCSCRVFFGVFCGIKYGVMVYVSELFTSFFFNFWCILDFDLLFVARKNIDSAALHVVVIE